jgi:hypothetical protein
MDQIPALADAGVNVIRVHLRRFASSPDQALSVLDEVVKRFEPMRALRA